MTYEDVLDWLGENVPVDMYEDYRDWYNACRNEIQTPALWDNPRFNRMHEQYFKDNRRIEDTSEPTFESTQREPVIETTIVTKRSDSNIVQEEQIITRLPETGKAPVITPMQFKEPEKPQRSFVQSVKSGITRFRRLIRL